jgi:uncharacterized membrane protein
MDAALLLAALWLAFAATHMGMSSLRLRPRLVAALGDRGFQGVYSLVALAIFVPLVGVYFAHKHQGPQLWYLGALPGMRHLMYAGMALAFALLVGGLTRPSPTGMIPAPADVRGVLRMTRHPVFMALGLYGAMHLLVTPVFATELAFFGGFPLFAWLGSRHQDARKRATATPELRSFQAATSLFPDPRRIVAALRDDPLPLGAGIALAVVVRVFHPRLFGP